MIQQPSRRTNGFTLVELVLSMAFISVLLLAIALLVLQVTSVYNKGLTLRAVNSAGQLVSSDMQRTLNQANPQQVEVAPQPEEPNQNGGRLCVGSTVYAWNYGFAVEDDSTLLFNEYEIDEDEKPTIRLVRFQKDENDYCTRDPVSNAYPKIPGNANEILVNGDKELALHQFRFQSSEEQGAAGDVGQTMFYISLRIGTSEQAILESNDLDESNNPEDVGGIPASGCEAPESRIDDEYCAVNDFTFVARAGSKEVTNE